MTPSKWFLIVGLGMSFAGLIVMIQFKRYNGWDNIHGKVHPRLNFFGWALTIAGYMSQFIGVVID